MNYDGVPRLRKQAIGHVVTMAFTTEVKMVNEIDVINLGDSDWLICSNTAHSCIRINHV